ncbi:hypothetical protein [Pseudonocardia alaniniphila]|uniref:Secreted protein n=1 Tax=Pseudonocardia alaniniphila TaxID=75291 RepID=A0ABS9TTS6_9PSEU|nr:hypothetical protein [Pseudonocardia alaniniphila]MCH6171978.1 hypothetical protein [Pseudonocardia alaniniphila]
MIKAGLLLICATAALFLLPVFVHAGLTPPVDGESSSSSSGLEMFATWGGIISGITGIVTAIVGMVSKRRRTPPGLIGPPAAGPGERIAADLGEHDRDRNV